jgi:hypothetical protein
MAVNTPYKDSTVTTTNHTANYDLPLWTGEDTTSWLTQMNDAMNKIDDGMVDAKSKALEVVGIAADAKKLADETKAESAASAKIVAGYNDRLTAAEEKIVEHTQDITNLNTRSDQFDVELHSVQEVQKKTTADLATLAAKVDANKSDADVKITANTEAIARIDANVATVSGKVTALETEVGEVSSTTQTNTNAISAINTTIDGIKAKDTEQDGKIAANTTEITSLDSRVTALEDGGSGIDVTQFYRHKSFTSTLSKSEVKNLSTYEGAIGDAQPIKLTMNVKLELHGDGSFFITLYGANLLTGPQVGFAPASYGFNISLSNAEFFKREDVKSLLGYDNVLARDFTICNTNYGVLSNNASDTTLPNTLDKVMTAANFQLSEGFLGINFFVVNSSLTTTDVKYVFRSPIIISGHLKAAGNME